MKEIKREGAEPTDEWYQHHEVDVDPKQSALRIDKYLFDKLEKLSRNRIQNACKAGAVLVNDKPVKSNYKIRPNDKIRIVLPKPPIESTAVVPEDIPLDIRYEDDELMIVYIEELKYFVVRALY